jgi:hypothetical protein
MNNVFDFHRWGLLVRKHWSDNRNKYLLSLGAITALLLLWFGFVIMADNYHPMQNEMQVVAFYVGLFLTGSIYASFLFGDLANKPKAINYLSVPASHLEKLLCMALYCVVIFFVCYTAIFYLADFIMVKVANAVAYSHWQEAERAGADHRPFIEQKVVNVFYQKDIARGAPFNMLLMILSIFFAVQGAYALGSIYFPAYSFIKTTIILLLVVLFFSFFMAKVLASMLPFGHFVDNLNTFRLREADYTATGQVILLPKWLMSLIWGVFKYILLPVFWITAYFRLKEKEV